MSRRQPKGTIVHAQSITHGHSTCHCHCHDCSDCGEQRQTASQGRRPWDNPDPLWGVPEWSNYVGIKPDFTRQLIKQGRITSTKIGAKTMLQKSVADEVIAAGRRPATQPLVADRFGNWR